MSWVVAWIVVICVLFIAGGMASVWLGAGWTTGFDLFDGHFRLPNVGIGIILFGLVGLVIALSAFLR